jgi:hypothetical protein
LRKQSVLKPLFYIYLLLSFFLPKVNGQVTSYWQQQVNYKIDVTLDDVTHTLDGFIKMDYFNNSPDTLHYIWIHLWPNAYKNDRTAFSDQLLENGRTDFYFSTNEKRGYINQMDFKVNGNVVKTEDHPQHQDIIKIILSHPLLPGSACKIETPFHVKLPQNFSRGGHVGQAYQITQWYPKPAVYDHKGWHAMPYLDQGEFYGEFGNYEVQITLPENYVVAATGNLQEIDEQNWLKKRKAFARDRFKKDKPNTAIEETVPSAHETKTLHFNQKNVHDFAWFTDKTFSVKADTLQLPSGRIIDVYVFFYFENEDIWSNSIQMIKQSVLTKSNWIGEYPYSVVSVVEDEKGNGGMEYPTITFLSSGETKKILDFVINHEVGHNWFYGILASNERVHPWMDEGMNTHYDNRYLLQQYGNTHLDFSRFKSAFLKKRMPDDIEQIRLQSLSAAKKDQPIETTSENFSSENYNAVAYTKTGNWMQHLEKALGKELFDSCMRTYYRNWGFKHPYPEDFKQLMEQTSGKNLDSIFSLLNKKGALPEPVVKKDLRFTSFFSLKETDKHNYIFAAPALGYNFYDKFMLGAIVHNYTLPPSKLQFIIAPLFAPQSKSFNGTGRISYDTYIGNNGAKLQFSVSGGKFNRDTYTDSTGTVNYLHFSKIVPSLKYLFAKKNARSTVTKFFQWKFFQINEQQLLFTRDVIRQVEVITYPIKSRYINQLQYAIENDRVLYPYKGAFMAEQGDGFIRINFNGNYYFNYAKGGGLDLRLFAGKFFYTADKTFLKQFETDIYHLNMTGPKGYEDYTYSNYFFGRNEFDQFSSQQIMIRDGGFKVRTDLLSNKVGKSDDWLGAVNFTSTIPEAINPLKILPVKIPLKLFFDIGTHAEAWKKDAATARFLYDGGLQLSLLKNMVNIYLPLVYSKVYKNYFLSTIPEKRFVKNIALSINLQEIYLKKLLPIAGF